jgi:hypothetical protein
MLPPFNTRGIGPVQLKNWPKISLFSLVILLGACGGGGSDNPVTSAPVEENNEEPLAEGDEPQSPGSIDNTGDYQLSLLAEDSILIEGDTTTLTFSLDKINDTAETMIVYYGVSGSSVSTEDFQALSGQINIPVNTASVSLTLNTLDDSIAENTESLLIELTTESLPDNVSLSSAHGVEITIRDNDGGDQSYDLTTRQGSQQFYEDEYLASAFQNNSWSGGNQNTCFPGSVPDETKNKTTQRLNYFRHLVGVNTIDHDDVLNNQAQKGAHVSQIQFDLGVTLTSAFHGPNEGNGNWICLDNDAAQAMGASSIAQVGSSWNAADTVDLFVWDPGANNSSAGHRDNLFRSDLNAVGIGATDQAVLIMTENNGDPTGMWTWPPALYVPKQILYAWQDFSRWSIRNEKAFIKWKNKESNGGITPNITVTNCEGENINVQNIKIADNKLLTWEVESNAQDIVNECEYQVTVKDYYLVQEEGNGAATGSLTEYNYSFTIFNAE